MQRLQAGRADQRFFGGIELTEDGKLVRIFRGLCRNRHIGFRCKADQGVAALLNIRIETLRRRCQDADAEAGLLRFPSETERGIRELEAERPRELQKVWQRLNGFLADDMPLAAGGLSEAGGELLAMLRRLAEDA